MTDTDTFLTLKTAAARLSVSPRTLTRWAEAGRIRIYRFGGSVRRLAKADLDDFIRKSAVEVTQ